MIMDMASKLDLVTTDFWEQQCDFGWQKDNPPTRDGIIFCPNEAVAEFFQWCESNPERKFTLVSAYSDFGIFYQKDFHPNKDFRKRCWLIQFDLIEKMEDNYVSVEISAVGKGCNVKHKYSVKIDSFTSSTFDRIPPNIKKWYCVNSNIEETEWIPLGINFQGHGKDIVSNYHTKNKKKLFYVNFTNFTSERTYLKEHYLNLSKNEQKWITVQENRLSIEDFYKELSEHVFILCPFGNGMDCYRLYETFAVGSIPILLDSIWSKKIMDLGLPVLLVDNLFGISYNLLMEILQNMSTNFDLSGITKQFWSKKLKGEL